MSVVPRCYRVLVTVRKLSIALEHAVAVAAAASAERHGQSLSAWMNDAAANTLAIEDGLAAVTEWEAEHGPFTDEELASADAALKRPIRRGSRARRIA